MPAELHATKPHTDAANICTTPHQQSAQATFTQHLTLFFASSADDIEAAVRNVGRSLRLSTVQLRNATHCRVSGSELLNEDSDVLGELTLRRWIGAEVTPKHQEPPTSQNTEIFRHYETYS